MDWTHFAPPMLAALLASLVEGIEALTVILAVGGVLGWRGALVGAGLALALLLALVAVLGPALTLIPSAAIHLAIGALLLVFGVRWLRKAVLRSAGVIPKRDELVAFARQNDRLRALGAGPRGGNRTAIATTFQITMIEGIEVVFIVLAVGSADHGLLWPASLGALLALVLVVALGVALHRPIARIPENGLKFIVGVLTSAFGIFWMGEGLGLRWPGDDWSVLALVVCILALALVAVQVIARRARPVHR